MAGHDINYIALTGVLSMLGTADGPPQPPANLLGDFAGGSMVCLLGILMALFERTKSNTGQIVEADMVAGARYVSSFLLLTSYLSHPSLGLAVNDGTDVSRGKNMLDGGAPWYGVYQCQDGGWMSVGAIEPQFYRQLLEILRKAVPEAADVKHPSTKTQHDRTQWPALRTYFTTVFAKLPRAEWEKHFIGTDACVAPVLTRDEAALNGITPPASKKPVFQNYPVVPSAAPRLSRTPAKNPTGSPGGEWEEEGAEMLLSPGEHTEDVLAELGISGSDKLAPLYSSGVVDGPDKPFVANEKAKL